MLRKKDATTIGRDVSANSAFSKDTVFAVLGHMLNSMLDLQPSATNYKVVFCTSVCQSNLPKHVPHAQGLKGLGMQAHMLTSSQRWLPAKVGDASTKNLNDFSTAHL